jgi:hypothetical protein
MDVMHNVHISVVETHKCDCLHIAKLFFFTYVFVGDFYQVYAGEW